LHQEKLKLYHSLYPYPINKSQGWEPVQQKYKANEKTNKNNFKKKKTKTKNQQKLAKDPMQRIFVTIK